MIELSDQLIELSDQLIELSDQLIELSDQFKGEDVSPNVFENGFPLLPFLQELQQYPNLCISTAGKCLI